MRSGSVRDPRTAAVRSQLALALQQRAALLSLRRNHTDAADDLKKAAEHGRLALALRPTEAVYRQRQRLCCLQWKAVLLQLGRTDEAAAAAAEAAALADAPAEQVPRSPPNPDRPRR